jgi:signal peptidase I
VVGVPGDEVAYLNKRLTINGKEVPQAALPDFFDETSMRTSSSSTSSSATCTTHHRRHAPRRLHRQPGPVPVPRKLPLQHRGRDLQGARGHYFMMGDNRDNSLDSRYWGFVPDRTSSARPSSSG